MDVTVMHAFRIGVAGALLSIPFTVLAFWLAERLPIDRSTWRSRVPLVLLAGAAMVLAKAVYVIVTNPWIVWYTELPSFASVLSTSVANNLFLFFLLVGLGHALTYARRVQEREEQLGRAELQHLKAQLHPHFLFNALNTVSAFVRTDPEMATQMIAKLSTLLRHALQRESTQEVTLKEEIAVLGAYVDIEQVRFDDRLRVIWQVESDTLYAQVPHLLMQPLVENAICHGIAPSSDIGTVKISAYRRNGTLHLCVLDDGVGRTTPTATGLGVGLTNTRNRLQQLYGRAQTLTVENVIPHGLRVDVSLPFREETVG